MDNKQSAIIQRILIATKKPNMVAGYIVWSVCCCLRDSEWWVYSS
jgi:hypothetical protein